MVLPQSFYNRSALKVARDLLGCFLVTGIKYKIVETEAYCGTKDLASHSSRGRTERNKVMFGPPGFFYVYFTYGMHYMLNVVTGPGCFPSAVLIRALEPAGDSRNSIEIKSHESNENKSHFPKIQKLFSGPAKLTKALGIDKRFNGQPAFTKKTGLWIESGTKPISSSSIMRAKRIGVDYAKNYKDKKWRFYIKDNGFISKK